MNKKYSMTNDDRLLYAALIILRDILKFKTTYPVILEGDAIHLEDLFTYMLSKGLVEMQNDRHYVPTAKGREACVKFERRYYEYLKVYDIYSFVDMEDGVFAFKFYFDMEDEEWNSFVEDERWEDLRIAIMELKKMNPIEIVFMQFLMEGRFDLEKEAWEFDLMNGLIWDDIVDACNNARTIKDFEYKDDDDKLITGEDVLKDVLEQGYNLMMELIEREKELDAQAEDEDCDDEEDEVVTEVIVEEIVEEEYIVEDAYFRVYVDPFYIAPIWYDPYW